MTAETQGNGSLQNPVRSVMHWALLIALMLCVGGASTFAPEVRAQSVDVGALSALQARAIGPAGMSGRIAAIDAWAADPNLIYVGAATGGLWKSVNGGTTWTPVFDDQRVNGIGAVAINQSNPDVVWVGTGEGNPRNSAGVGAGIYRTVDGGATWSFLGLENSERIHRIVLDPRNPDVAWAGALGPAWSDGEERGVFKTTDGGVTWRRVLFVDERTGASDLVQDPRNPDHLIAGMWSYRRWPWFFESGGPGSGVFQTFDGGESWERITSEHGLPEGELGRIGLAFAASDPDVVYALIEARPRGLHRSDDGGRTWAPVNVSPQVNPRPFYYTDIYVDPTNELRLYNLHSRFQISEDGGKSFEGIESSVHSDFHALWINPNDSRHFLLGTDGGVYVTLDRGKTFREFDNLPVGQFYHIAVDMDVPYNVYGGMQDNGSWRGPSTTWTNGGVRNWMWEEVNFGDGFATILDPTETHYGYAMSQGGNLRRFDLRTGERKDVRPWAPDSVELRFNWNAPIAQDPFDQATIYYGSQFVHRSTDRGDSWEILSPDLTTNDPEKQKQSESGGITEDNTGAENHTSLMTIAPSPVEEGVIWTGSDDGKVHVTRDDGGAWEDVTDRIPGVPDGTWVPHIEADKFAPGAAYVVFEDHRRGNWEPFVYRTENYGRDWERVVGQGDVWGFVHVVEQDPVDPRLLFLGTEFGLWVSLDAGASWSKWTHGFPTVPVRALTVHPRDHDLVIGTHGRAAYVLDDVRPLRALAGDPGLLAQGIHLVEPPPALLVSRVQENGYHFPADAMFSGESRPMGALLTYVVGAEMEGGAGGGGGGEAREATPQADSVTLQVLSEDGETLRSFKAPGDPGVHRVVWNLQEDAPESESGGGGGGGGFRGSPQGPEVLPGMYTVRVLRGDARSERPIAVLPDPRVDIPMSVRVAKREAIEAGLALNVDFQALRGVLEDVGEAMSRLEEVLAAPGNEDAREALRDPMRAVRDRSAELNQAFRDAQRNSRALFSLAGSRDAPTEAQRLALDRFERDLDALRGQVDELLAGPVSELRIAVEASGLEVFPEIGGAN